MQIYHSRYKKRKKQHPAVIFCVIVGLALCLLSNGTHSLFDTLTTEGKKFCYEKMLEFYMPTVICSVKEEQELPVLERFFLSLFSDTKPEEETMSYQTQIESELSYEMILAREAADENYVDEVTGELVEADDAVICEEDPSAMSENAALDAEIVKQESQNNSGTLPPESALSAVQRQKAVTYSREKLADFDYLIQNFYQIDRTTTIGGSQLNADALLGRDVRLSHDASTPQILIYHTHSQEAYADSIPGDASQTVVGVGDYLAQILTEKYGFSVLHHKGAYDVGDRDHAYAKAGPALEQILAENPGIEVVIDLHRDGVREDTHLVTEIDGKKTAQIMFFNGLSRTTGMGDIAYLYNPYLTDNLAVSFQMQLAAAEYYPGFTRKIYLKGYRYNMHYCPKTLLIEVGAQTNTVQEARNAMEPLADVLHKVLTGQQD